METTLKEGTWDHRTYLFFDGRVWKFVLKDRGVALLFIVKYIFALLIAQALVGGKWGLCTVFCWDFRAFSVDSDSGDDDALKNSG